MEPTRTNTNESRVQWVIVAVVVAVVLLGGILLVAKKHGTGGNANITPLPTLPKEVAVTLSDSGFNPNTVTIGVGSAVRWTNDSSDGKGTVNSDDYPTNQKFKELNLGTFQKGSTLVHIFNTPGTYTYHDQFHPTRKGTVVVK